MSNSPKYPPPRVFPAPPSAPRAFLPPPQGPRAWRGDSRGSDRSYRYREELSPRPPQRNDRYDQRREEGVQGPRNPSTRPYDTYRQFRAPGRPPGPHVYRPPGMMPERRISNELYQADQEERRPHSREEKRDRRSSVGDKRAFEEAFVANRRVQSPTEHFLSNFHGRPSSMSPKSVYGVPSASSTTYAPRPPLSHPSPHMAAPQPSAMDSESRNHYPQSHESPSFPNRMAFHTASRGAEGFAIQNRQMDAQDAHIAKISLQEQSEITGPRYSGLDPEAEPDTGSNLAASGSGWLANKLNESAPVIEEKLKITDSPLLQGVTVTDSKRSSSPNVAEGNTLAEDFHYGHVGTTRSTFDKSSLPGEPMIEVRAAETMPAGGAEEEDITKADVQRQIEDIEKTLLSIDTRLDTIAHERARIAALLDEAPPSPVHGLAIEEQNRATIQKIIEVNRRRALQVRDEQLEEGAREHMPQSYPFYDKNISTFRRIASIIHRKIRHKLQLRASSRQERRQEYYKLHTEWIASCAAIEAMTPRLPPAGEKKAELEGQEVAKNDFARSDAELDAILERSKMEHALDPTVRARANAAKLPPMDPKSPKFIDSNLLVKKGFEEVYGLHRLDDWTGHEHEKFCLLFERYPKQFGKIAENMGGRDREDCLFHYYATKKDTAYKDMLRKAGRKGKAGRRRRVAPGKGKGLLRELAGDDDEDEVEADEEVSDARQPQRSVAPSTFQEETEKQALEQEMLKKKNRQVKKSGRRRKEVDVAAALSAIRGPEEDAAQTLAAIGWPRQSAISALQDQDRVTEDDQSEESPMPSNRDMLPSSYWSAREVQDFARLLEEFGTDWNSMANVLTKKTPSMLRNYFQRLLEKHPEYLTVSRQADAKRGAVLNPTVDATSTTGHFQPFVQPMASHDRLEWNPSLSVPGIRPGPRMGFFTEERPPIGANTSLLPPNLQPSVLSHASMSVPSSHPVLLSTVGSRNLEIGNLLNNDPVSPSQRLKWFDATPDANVSPKDGHTGSYFPPVQPTSQPNLFLNILNPIPRSSESNERGA